MNIGFTKKEAAPSVVESPSRGFESALGPSTFTPSRFVREIINGVILDYRVNAQGQRRIISSSRVFKK